jgi:hypothetical protein
MTTIDRTTWPWHSAPVGCNDYDAAVWHATRARSEAVGGYLLPRQDLEVWVLEQRARRSREVLGPEPLTDTGHAQLRADLAVAWRGLDSSPSARRFAGRLPR